MSPIGCVPKRNNKFRLITDLRKLNAYCDVPGYRNEDMPLNYFEAVISA